MSPDWLHGGAGVPALPHEAPIGPPWYISPLLSAANPPFPAGECSRAEPVTTAQPVAPRTPAAGAGYLQFELRATPEHRRQRRALRCAEQQRAERQSVGWLGHGGRLPQLGGQGPAGQAA